MTTLRTPVARLLPVLLLCLAIGVPAAALGGATGPAPAAAAKKKCKKKAKKRCNRKMPVQPQPVVTPPPAQPAPVLPGPPAPPPVIQLSQGALTVTEGATDATTTVTLAAQPTSNVTVTLTSSDPAAATVTPPTLTFTPANFATPQLLTVGGTEDPDAAPDSATVTASSPGATSVTLAVSVTDNDFAGITVSPSSGVIVPEGGTDSSITIVLNAQPQANVEIPLASSSASKMTVSPTSMTFTAANWNVPQAVTLTGTQDPDVIDEVVFLRTFAAASADPAYSGFNAPDVSVTVNDDDTQRIVADPGSLKITEGAAGSIGVTLEFQPNTNVTVSASSSDTDVATVSPASRTFNFNDYFVSQSFTINAVADEDNQNDIATVTLSAPGVADTTVDLTILEP